MPTQCRMARAALELGVRDLAGLANVSPNTVARLERGEELRKSTLDAIRTALEKAGVEFIVENGGGPGVRLRKAKSLRHRREAAPPEAVTAKAEHRFAKADKQRAGIKADLKKEIAREKGRLRKAKT